MKTRNRSEYCFPRKRKTIFFYGQIYEAYSLLLDILQSAKKEIIIIETSASKELLDILKESLEDARVLDLTGCTLDAVLYYVNRDIPVLAMMQDGTAVLIVGFNEKNTVVMNPEIGNVYKVGMNDSTEWFEQNGNHFITYIRDTK